MRYLTAKENFKETVISKSRFLTYVYEITDSLDAQEKITALRKKYYDSTHVCYAYVADELGNDFKFSDDGEPSGTAGIPIYEAIKNGGYKKTLAVVVRYFGGIKLGAGGLVRAYSGCASQCLSSAKKGEYIKSEVCQVEFEIGLYSKLSRILAQKGKILAHDFSQNVSVKMAFPLPCDFTLLEDCTNGKCKITKLYDDFIDYGTN